MPERRKILERQNIQDSKRWMYQPTRRLLLQTQNQRHTYVSQIPGLVRIEENATFDASQTRIRVSDTPERWEETETLCPIECGAFQQHLINGAVHDACASNQQTSSAHSSTIIVLLLRQPRLLQAGAGSNNEDTRNIFIQPNTYSHCRRKILLSISTSHYTLNPPQKSTWLVGLAKFQL